MMVAIVRTDIERGWVVTEENTEAKTTDERTSEENAMPEIGGKKGLSIAPAKSFIGNRPIASNQAEGEDALMGYLD